MYRTKYLVCDPTLLLADMYGMLRFAVAGDSRVPEKQRTCNFLTYKCKATSHSKILGCYIAQTV